MIAGTIKLYNLNGMKIRSLCYYNKEERVEILKRWHRFYGHKFETGYYQIIPFIVDNYVNIDVDKPVHKKVNFEPVEKPLKEIEMDDFIMVGSLKHETWYHKVYYKN